MAYRFRAKFTGFRTVRQAVLRIEFGICPAQDDSREKGEWLMSTTQTDEQTRAVLILSSIGNKVSLFSGGFVGLTGKHPSGARSSSGPEGVWPVLELLDKAFEDFTMEVK